MLDVFDEELKGDGPVSNVADQEGCHNYYSIPGMGNSNKLQS